MNYTVTLSLLGLAQIGLGVATGGIAGFFWAWSGASFLAVGMAYAGIGPRIFGKRPNGTLFWGNTLLLFPYMALTNLISWAKCRVRPDSKHEIVDGLFLGQRLTNVRDLPEGTALVVDFTSELHEPKEIRAGRQYLYVPTLDTHVPEDRLLRAAIDTIVRQRDSGDGAVYVHCALGRGRSAMAVAGVLLASGLAESVQEAEAMVRARRTGIRLSRAQKAALERYQQSSVECRRD